MAKKDLEMSAKYSHAETITLVELCQLFHVSEEDIGELIANEIILPSDQSSHHLIFDLTQLQRVKRALRLHYDLEINFPTVAIIMDLLDQMDELRTHMEIVRKHYFYR